MDKWRKELKTPQDCHAVGYSLAHAFPRVYCSSTTYSIDGRIYISSVDSGVNVSAVYRFLASRFKLSDHEVQIGVGYSNFRFYSGPVCIDIATDFPRDLFARYGTDA